MRKTSRFFFFALFLSSGLMSVGCIPFQAPVAFNPGWAGIPLPVTPFLQDREEEKFWEKERYKRVPVLGPLTAGGPTKALDPPTPDEVIRALEKAHPTKGGIPFLHEVQRNNVRMTIEPIADYIDPPRVHPIIGPAQQHHAHYKCTLYYSETIREGWPLPHTKRDEEKQEVIYIDHNHFHMVGNVSPGGGHEGHAH